MEGMALNELFGGIYSGRNVLVTGHTGFKGTWLAYWLTQMGAHVAGLALDPDTAPSHWSLLDLVAVHDHRVDLRDAAAVCAVLESERPDIVFHLAAQPLVRRSYRDPVGTFDINVMGLANLYEAIRRCPSVRVVVNATTDKVYADRMTENGYRETDQLGGHDPYSTSKACAELVSDSYRKSYFGNNDGRGFAVRLATARAGNVIGGGDWAEDRLVPDLVRAGISGKPLMLRNPQAIRPWQHVLEPLAGYLRLGQALFNGDAAEGAWNFGPDNDGELSVGALVNQLTDCWPSLRMEHDRTPQPHEAAVLRLNCDKAKHGLACHPAWNIATTIARTGDWYRTFHETGQLQTASDLNAYIDDARRSGLGWAA